MRQVLGRKKMSLLVLPILAETVLERLGLLLRGETRNQVGVAAGDAFLLEGFRNLRDELESESRA
jgi:hypothetical protein